MIKSKHKNPDCSAEVAHAFRRVRDDVGKLEKMLEIHQQWEANEARKAFVAAKVAFRAEAPAVTKDHKVGYDHKKGSGRTSYRHATLANVERTLGPVLAKHGLAYAWQVDQKDNGQIYVTCVLSHEMGHQEQVTLHGAADQSGQKNSIQATGSTVTYLERYTLLAITGTATEGQDDDGEGGPDEEAATLSKEQIAGLKAMCAEVGGDEAKLLQIVREKATGFDIEDWSDVPGHWYGNIVKQLEQKRGKPAAPTTPPPPAQEQKEY